ncbi:MAG: hypothetical protein ACOCX9_04355 [Spirochaetota bacterium]
MDNYSDLKKNYTIHGRAVSNRFFAQAMEINRAGDGGSVSDAIIERYRKLARGSWGIVSLEAVSVTPESLARPNGLILNEKNLDGFKKLVEAFKKENPDSLLFFQLTHSGRQSGSFSRRVKMYEDEDDSCRVLTTDELSRITDEFHHAVRLAAMAGADGVDIKACHGYLLGEMLRPANTREDGYGNDPMGRTRILREIFQKASRDYPRLITGSRISLYEGIRGGCGTDGPDELIENTDNMMDSIALCEKAGAHYINVSAGVPAVTPHVTRPVKSNSFFLYYHFRYQKLVKEHFPGLTVIGSAYSSAREEGPMLAGENLKKNYVDLAGFGRQNLADPLTPRKIMDGNADQVNYCTLCGGCSRLLKKHDPVHCIVYDNEDRK